MVSPANGNRSEDENAATPPENALNETPRKVAVVADGLMILNEVDMEFLYAELHRRIWEYMKCPARLIPLFVSCSKLDPYGVAFVCNDDAVDWLKTTVETRLFANRRIVVYTEDTFPQRVKMCVRANLNTKYSTRKIGARRRVAETSPPSNTNTNTKYYKPLEGIFTILVNTNRNLFVTGQWIFAPADSASAKASVFAVPLADVPRLRARGFQLFFLFGKVTAEFYRPELPQTST